MINNDLITQIVPYIHFRKFDEYKKYLMINKIWKASMIKFNVLNFGTLYDMVKYCNDDIDSFLWNVVDTKLLKTTLTHLSKTGGYTDYYNVSWLNDEREYIGNNLVLATSEEEAMVKYIHNKLVYRDKHCWENPDLFETIIEDDITTDRGICEAVVEHISGLFNDEDGYGLCIREWDALIY
jgi:hypothetical protein